MAEVLDRQKFSHFHEVAEGVLMGRSVYVYDGEALFGAGNRVYQIEHYFFYVMDGLLGSDDDE